MLYQGQSLLTPQTTGTAPSSACTVTTTLCNWESSCWLQLHMLRGILAALRCKPCMLSAWCLQLTGHDGTLHMARH